MEMSNNDHFDYNILSLNCIIPEHSELAEQFICCICQNIVDEPETCSKCKHSFCKGCIEKWLKIKNSCPNRCPYVKENYNKSLINLLNKLKFKCEECGKVSTVENFKSHSKICPNRKINCLFCNYSSTRIEFPQHQNECIYQELECSYCYGSFLRVDLFEHEEKCMNKESKCHYCNELIKFSDAKTHLKHCEQFKLKLKCKVCDEVFERDDVRHNLISCIKKSQDKLTAEMNMTLKENEKLNKIISDENSRLMSLVEKTNIENCKSAQKLKNISEEVIAYKKKIADLSSENSYLTEKNLDLNERLKKANESIASNKSNINIPKDLNIEKNNDSCNNNISNNNINSVNVNADIKYNDNNIPNIVKNSNVSDKIFKVNKSFSNPFSNKKISEGCVQIIPEKEVVSIKFFKNYLYFVVGKRNFHLVKLDTNFSNDSIKLNKIPLENNIMKFDYIKSKKIIVVYTQSKVFYYTLKKNNQVYEAVLIKEFSLYGHTKFSFIVKDNYYMYSLEYKKMQFQVIKTSMNHFDLFIIDSNSSNEEHEISDLKDFNLDSTVGYTSFAVSSDYIYLSTNNFSPTVDIWKKEDFRYFKRLEIFIPNSAYSPISCMAYDKIMKYIVICYGKILCIYDEQTFEIVGKVTQAIPHPISHCEIINIFGALAISCKNTIKIYDMKGAFINNAIINATEEIENFFFTLTKNENKLSFNDAIEKEEQDIDFNDIYENKKSFIIITRKNNLIMQNVVLNN